MKHHAEFASMRDEVTTPNDLKRLAPLPSRDMIVPGTDKGQDA